MNNLFYYPNNNPNIAETNISTPIGKPVIKYISYEGGGLTGFQHNGALMYLQEQNLLKDLVAVSGSSFGAIMALSTVLKIPVSKIVSTWESTKYSVISLWDIIWLPYNLIFNYGIKDLSLLKWMGSTVLKSGNVKEDITFEELYAITGIKLVITITNISRNITEYCSHITTPKRKVIDMLAISCSIPLAFQATKLENDEYYCDGGVYTDIASAYLKREFGGNEFSKHGLAFYMDSKKYGSYNPINNLFDYSLSLTLGTISASSNKEITAYGVIDGDMRYVDKNVISLITPSSVSVLTLNLTHEQILILLKNGYDTTKNFFQLNYQMD